MTLNQLFNKYGSDKGDATPEGHNYGPFYEQTLPKNPKRMLEIGVHKGASARAWKEWFPEVEFHGLDLFSEYSEPTDIPGAIWHKGNQVDHLLLEQLRKENFDIIIDDGSHLSRHMMMTFYGLMHDSCHYYIEDLHCNVHEFYRDGLPLCFCANVSLNASSKYINEHWSLGLLPVVIKGTNIELIKVKNL